MNTGELKIARIRRNLSSKDLAKKLNWKPSVYSYKENGNRPLSLSDAQKIAKSLKLSPEEILLIFFDMNTRAGDNKI